jgi:squalene-hopene/tetraprenyl-beta-curcumene cyclase
MKLKIMLATLSIIIANFAIAAQSTILLSDKPQIPETLLRESNAAILRGTDFLLSKQLPDGSWIQHPAVTGLCVIALHNSNTTANLKKRKNAISKGVAFIKKFVQKDGSIWIAGQEHEYPNYTTAVALCALAVVNDSKDEPIMRNARKYLLNSQVTDKKSPNFGGIGYGKSGPGNPDLSNTQWALEALYLTDYLDNEQNAKNREDIKKSDQAWKNAVQFLTKLQHCPETNDAAWVVKDPKDPNSGSFIYKTNESKASMKVGDKKSLRGYGSMTYAGLKSMIYARLKKDDPRVKAAVEWGAKHYDLTKNPGMGPEGHYYYLHTFTKAHAVLGDETIKTTDGKTHFWRIDLIKELLNRQKSKGEWYNEKSGRWWESVPELVTSYALISMETALGSKITN